MPGRGDRQRRRVAREGSNAMRLTDCWTKLRQPGGHRDMSTRRHFALISGGTTRRTGKSGCAERCGHWIRCFDSLNTHSNTWIWHSDCWIIHSSSWIRSCDSRIRNSSCWIRNFDNWISHSDSRFRCFDSRITHSDSWIESPGRSIARRDSSPGRSDTHLSGR